MLRKARPEMGSPPRFFIFSNVSTNLPSLRAAALAVSLLFLVVPVVRPAAPESATILWRGQSHAVALAGANEFAVVDAARALGFDALTDSTTGVLSLSGFGHQIFVGSGTSQVPVDQRIVAISRSARTIGATLYAPADFLEKVLFPLVGATGTYEASKRVWTLTETTPALTLEVAVVHVDPTTQVVIKQSAPAHFLPSLTEAGFQVRWPDQKLLPPYAQRRYEDLFVAGVRFVGDTVKIEFREKGLTARAYPLTGPDRIVIEVGPPSPAAPGGPVPAGPVLAAPSAGLTIVLDAGHGGTETGAIGPAGQQEKEITLQIARRLAATIPRFLSCRVVLTRDSDSAISLDDRTALANHEKADLFLSVHANSSRASGARGSETYYLSLEASDKLAQEVASRENQVGPSPTPGAAPSRGRDLDFILWDLAQSAHLRESSELAEAIQRELNVLSGTENRGIKQAPFRVLVGATMPAVLVETAFISNPEEEKKLASPAFQQNVADAIAKAVGNFFARRRSGSSRTPVAPTPARTP